MFLKVLFLVSAVVMINCRHHDGGRSNSFREQDHHGNYKFGYNIYDKHGGENHREEKGDGHGNVVGSYTLGDGHGGKRVVHYMADKTGFRTKVQTNEKGTSDEDSADAIYNGMDDKSGHYHNHHQNDNHNHYHGHVNHDNHNSYNNHDDNSYDNHHKNDNNHNSDGNNDDNYAKYDASDSTRNHYFH